MADTKQYYYKKVAKAIEYLENNFKEQPDLEALADHVHVSQYHFQKIFTEWVGISPKKYLQYVSLDYAKMVLSQSTLSNTAYNTGLSGTGRLHDMFVNIEGMTPGEFKNGGRNLSINYCFADSCFGRILVGSTTKGICHISFSDDNDHIVTRLRKCFPNAYLQHKTDEIQHTAINFFNADWSNLSKIKLHLKGSNFQLKVWEALLKIPSGRLSTYGKIATNISNPKASRAVGRAIGTNPVAYLIPCHRVIKASGSFGQYHWGSTRKKIIIGWEAAKAGNL